MIVLASICFLVALAGAVVAIVGVLGKRIGVAPHCGHCSFDLSGLNLASGASPNCPECGATLSGRRAIRHGRLLRRTQLIVLGLTLAILGVGTGGFAFYNWTQSATPAQLPTAMLLFDAYLSGGTSSTDAIDEVAGRIANDQISHPLRNYLIRSTLASRRSSSGWDKKWTSIVAAGRLANCVSDSDWIEFVKPSVELSIECRDQVRSGAKLNVTYHYGAPSLKSSPFLDRVCEMEMNTMEIIPGDDRRRLFSAPGEIMRGFRHQWFNHPVIPGPAGCDYFEAIGLCTLRDPRNPSKSIAVWTVSAAHPIEILPGDVPTVLPLFDLSLQDLVKQSIQFTRLDLVQDSPDWIRGQAAFTSTGIGIPLAFEAILRPRDGPLSGQEFPWTTFSLDEKGGGYLGWGASAKIYGATAVDLILRPSISAAEATSSFRTIWMGDDIVFPSFPVRKATSLDR